MPDLTEIYAAANNIERNLNMPEGTTLQLFKGSVLLATLGENDGWFPEDVDFRATGGKKFKKISVFDPDRKFTSALANFDVCKIGSKTFKVSDKDEPFEQTREWILELQPIGQSPA